MSKVKTRTNQPVYGVGSGDNILTDFLNSKLPSGYTPKKLLPNYSYSSLMQYIYKEDGIYKVGSADITEEIEIYAYQMLDTSYFPIHTESDSEEINHLEIKSSNLDDQNYLTTPTTGGSYWKVPLEDIYGLYT